ncbi:NAD(+)/NADH kinase [Oligoflexia bacterium]|nr:NAD(+)/NADH kinase [Oligoflexia bacterium]
MAKIGLAIRPGVPEALALGRELLAWAEKHEHEILLKEGTAEMLGKEGAGLSAPKLTVAADPIVTLGGDGTLIGIARYVNRKSPVMVGVNFGNLGFLTEVLPAELFPVLENVLAGNIEIGQRRMLRAEVIRDTESVFSSSAVNDAVILKGSRDPLFEMDLFVENESVMRLRGDGVIIATPTGSTAYSLAAGGSIAHPWLSVLLVTPICPHSLSARPLLLPLELNLSIELPPYEGRVFLSIDGQQSFSLQAGDVISINKSKRALKFVRSPNRSYFDILRTKLNWGIDNEVG